MSGSWPVLRGVYKHSSRKTEYVAITAGGLTLRQRMWRAGVLAAAAAVVVMFLWSVRAVLYPFVLALAITYIMNPLVNYGQGKGLSRLWAIIAAYLLVFGGLGVLLYYIVPPITRELQRFGQDMPAITMRTEAFILDWQQRYHNSPLPPMLRDTADNAIRDVSVAIQDMIGGLANSVVKLFAHLLGILLAPILAFYLLLDWQSIARHSLRLVPQQWRRRLLMLVKDVDHVLSGVIRGQLLVAVIVGVLISLGLFLLRVKFAVLIGILAGALDIIPYFGAFIGATPAVGLALLESPWLAVKVVLLFFLVHQLEGSIIGPQIMGESVGLHPVTVIFALFIGGELAGLWGMLLAVPVAAVLKVVCRHVVDYLISTNY